MSENTLTIWDSGVDQPVTATLWDSNWNQVARVDVDASAVNDREPGVLALTLPTDHPAAVAILAALPAETGEVHIVLDQGGSRWSGSIAQVAFTKNVDRRNLTVHCAHAEHRSGLDRILESLSAVTL